MSNSLACMSVIRLNNPVSVTRGQRLNRVTSLIYQSQSILNRWDYGRFYIIFFLQSFNYNNFMSYLPPYFKSNQVQIDNFHVFFFAQTDGITFIWIPLCQFVKNWMLILVLICENERQRWDASRYIKARNIAILVCPQKLQIIFPLAE